MKRFRFISVICLAMALVFALAACGSTDTTGDGAADAGDASAEAEVADEAEAADEAAQTVDAYTVTMRDTTIIMNAEAEPIIEGLGDDYSYFESESCAFEGLDKVYSYSGFKLNTYPVDDVDYVSSVVFMDDTVETDEGICIGSAKDDVIEAYGEADEDNGTVMTYEKGDSVMTIGINEDGAVSSFEIDAITE